MEAQRDVPNETCFQREERLRQARERAEIAWTKAQDAASGGFLRSEEAWLRANRPDWDAGFHTRDVDVIHQKRALGTDESATVPNELLSLQTDLSGGSPAGRRRLSPAFSHSLKSFSGHQCSAVCLGLRQEAEKKLTAYQIQSF